MGRGAGGHLPLKIFFFGANDEITQSHRRKYVFFLKFFFG